MSYKTGTWEQASTLFLPQFPLQWSVRKSTLPPLAIGTAEKGSRAVGHMILVPVAQLCLHEAEDVSTCHQMGLLGS